MVIVFEEGDVAGFGLTEGSRRVNGDIAVAQDLALHQFRKLPHRDIHAQPSFLP
jgi:hypothetical protein